MIQEYDIQDKIESIWKMESPKIIALLTRMVKDDGLAQDLAQDTLTIALKRWPASGLPDNPAAWLMTDAKRHAIDYIRRDKLRDQKYQEIAYQLSSYQEHDWEEDLDKEIKNEMLGLLFMTCHPVLSKNARVSLTLRVLGGLTTEEIASAFLIPEPTVAQRIVRAKRTLRAADVTLEVPPREKFAERLPSVLEVIYLMFNEGYASSSNDDLLRPVLCSEALKLGRALVEILPEETEVLGLFALMLIQASRFRARLDTEGRPILLLDQDRTLWDHPLIHHGLSTLEKAERLEKTIGVYRLQASIAACHARAETAKDTDWKRISALYHDLNHIAPSPVIELNRAVAISMAYGPAAGLKIADSLRSDPYLKDYYLLPSTRATLLKQIGQQDEAYEEFMRASVLTSNPIQQQFLRKQAEECRNK